MATPPKKNEDIVEVEGEENEEGEKEEEEESIYDGCHNLSINTSSADFRAGFLFLIHTYTSRRWAYNLPDFSVKIKTLSQVLEPDDLADARLEYIHTPMLCY